MGMFDSVDFPLPCPACEAPVEWQTKERDEPRLDTLHWKEVSSFHTFCSDSSALHGDSGCGSFTTYRHKGDAPGTRTHRFRDGDRAISEYQPTIERNRKEEVPVGAFCWDRFLRRRYGIRVRILRYDGSACSITFRRDWRDARSWRFRSNIRAARKEIEKAANVWWLFPVHWSVFAPLSRTYVLAGDIPVVPSVLLLALIPPTTREES